METVLADQPPYPGTPRWVKVAAAIAILLLLLLGTILITGVGGPHGPQRHLPVGSDDQPTSSQQ